MLRIWRCDFASLETSFHAANHTIPPPPSYEGLPRCTKDKNRSPFYGEKPLKIVICFYEASQNDKPKGRFFWFVRNVCFMFQPPSIYPKNLNLGDFS